MLNIANHRLNGSTCSTNVVWDPTPNHNGAVTPKFLVFHYTACSFNAALSTFKRTTGENRKSAHLLVNMDGSVTQLVDLNLRAWHAGESSWGALQDINTHSIGVEVVNYGYLLKTAANGFKLSSGEAAPVKAEEVVEVQHRFPNTPYKYWQCYTAEQIEACCEVAALLVSHYGLTEILGHDDIAPTRKVDPGPAFPMNRMRSLAFGRDSEVNTEELAYVAVPKLNIRTGPGVEYPLAGGPLSMNTKLQVLARQVGWLQVLVEAASSPRGWVSSAYTRLGSL